MATEQVWWRPEGRSPFALDPTKPAGPQIFSVIWQSGIIFGGPLLGLVTISHYPFLIQDRTLYIGGLASIVFWFLASFVIPHWSDFPRGTPAIVKLQFRAGLGLCMTGLVLGFVGIANGYGTPLVSREVPVVAKRQTLERDASRRTYYLAIRAWPDSRTVVELGAPRAVYDRLEVPLAAFETPQRVLNAMADAGYVQLTVGEGRFRIGMAERNCSALGIDFITTTGTGGPFHRELIAANVRFGSKADLSNVHRDVR